VGLATVAFALVAPWLVGGITGPRGPGDLALGAGVALGLWAHLAALPPAVALGALASRPVTRTTLYGVAVLVSGAVLVIVLGLGGSRLGWLAPPVLAAARTLAGRPDAPGVLGLTGQAALWSAAALTAYARLRRTRA
jgi:hypothetical protein